MNTKSTIVSAARDLFWKQGFSATSVGEILSAAEAGSGSLYYFFKGKEDVLEEVLNSYLDLLDPAIVEPATARSEDPIEQIFHILDGYRQGLLASDFNFACPIGRVALEMSSQPPESIRVLVADNFTQWCDAVETRLAQAGGRLPSDLDRPGLARFVLTVMEGAVMQAATARNIQPFDASVAHLRSYFGCLAAQASATDEYVENE